MTEARDKESTLLKMRGIHKWYGKGDNRHHVLKNVELTVKQGEFLSLIGTSGSGKTTMLNIIGGLDSRFEGTVEISGYDIQKLSDKKLSRLRNETMGFVFQAFNLLPHITCVENVMMPAHFGGDLMETGEERAKSLLELVGLGDKINDHPTQLSGGQKQRVAIARALFNRPRLILCDEPTGSLDSETGRQILALFRRLNREEQLSFVIVTHDENISRNCDRIVRIEDGVIIRDEPNRPRDDLIVGGQDRLAAKPEALLVPSLLPSPSGFEGFAFEAHLDVEDEALEDSSPMIEGDIGVAVSNTGGLSWEAHTEEARAEAHVWLLGEGEREMDLNRAFHCSLSHSMDGEQPLLHLTLRQQNDAGVWTTLGLSAATSSGDEDLMELPEKPEHFPLTDEASMRKLLGMLRGAMHRQGRERWL